MSENEILLVTTLDETFEFVMQELEKTYQEMREQLIHDDKRWGETWRCRPRAGQEDRMFARFNDYFAQYKNAGVSIPWLKVIGEAHIALVRENHPELLFPEPKE